MTRRAHNGVQIGRLAPSNLSAYFRSSMLQAIFSVSILPLASATNSCATMRVSQPSTLRPWYRFQRYRNFTLKVPITPTRRGPYRPRSRRSPSLGTTVCSTKMVVRHRTSHLDITLTTLFHRLRNPTGSNSPPKILLKSTNGNTCNGAFDDHCHNAVLDIVNRCVLILATNDVDIVIGNVDSVCNSLMEDSLGKIPSKCKKLAWGEIMATRASDSAFCYRLLPFSC
jgi:hypothetical protein